MQLVFINCRLSIQMAVHHKYTYYSVRTECELLRFHVAENDASTKIKKLIITEKHN